MRFTRFPSARILILLAPLLAVPSLPSAATACTLWAAAGERAAEGVLIAKNRDWKPEADEVRMASLKGGRRYVGLFPIREGFVKPGAVAGISEMGLVFVSATAGSVPAAEREKGAAGLSGKILSCESVAEVLKAKEMFIGGRPAIYLLADRERIAWIEVAPRGLVEVMSTDSGTLCHTNHYLAEKLGPANVRIGRSSSIRHDRIRQLLETGPSLLTRADFIAFSRDMHAGPDNSIWRTGGKPGGERTLATWIVALPKAAPPELLIRLANPGEDERYTGIRLDASFWQGKKGSLF
jgi:hypothetical protein